MKKINILVKFSSRIFIIIIATSMLSTGRMHAATTSVTDSLRVLCTLYGEKSGLDGVTTISAILDCDSLHQPLYVIGDSAVAFISDIRVDAIKKMHLVTNKKFTRQFAKEAPNGILYVDLADGADFNSAMALPMGDNLKRDVFLTKFSLAETDNAEGSFSNKVKKFASEFGTDDEVFRRYSAYNEGQETAILAVDTLGNMAFVRSFEDFRQGAIGDITVFDATEAMNIIGNKGLNGMVLVTIDSKFTVREALLGQIEKMMRTEQEMYRVNKLMLYLRNPIIID